MTTKEADRTGIADWDRAFTERLVGTFRPVVKAYFRSEVRGLELIPPGGVLVVANHSGGLLPMDASVFVVDFYREFGYERPVFTLSHDDLFHGPLSRYLVRAGFIRATPEHAEQALHAGAVVVVFPGGDYDVYRPTNRRNVIDFDGRTGYAETAIEAGVPIVPMVFIGGQETQFYLSRGMGLARALRVSNWEHHLFRSRMLPITFGFPFGLSIVLPVNMPLPAKVVAQVLPPIDLVATFGARPDVDEVDDHVRHVMQAALDELARQRRLPIVG